FVEVPHELAPSGLPGVALAVFGKDGNARAKERHGMRRDDGDAFHQIQYFRRVRCACQQWKAALHDPVCGVVLLSARSDRSSGHGRWRKRGAGILGLEPIDYGLDAINILILDVVFFAELCRDVYMSNV